MQPPTIGALPFLRGTRQQGFLAFAGDMWKTHGDVFQVRLGSKTMLFAMHPDAVTQVNLANRKNYDKLKSYDNVRKYITGKGLVASTGELWLRQRRLMAPFYTRKGVQTYAELMLADSVQLADRWSDLATEGTEVEIAEEMTQVTAAIILHAMFSTETMEAIDEMREAVETIVGFSGKRLAAPGAPLWVPTPGNRRYVAARKLVHRTISDLIAQRRAIPQEDWPSDLLSKLMTARDPDTGATMDEELLRDESITTFFAGHETTARTMTFTWYALAANPGAAARLHEELDRVLGDRTPTVDDLKKLPYTLQVVKEVLRLYPAAPFYARDAVGSDTIGGFDVPAGTSVMLSPYYTHRHPDFWQDPERFDPDRWAPEKEAAQHKHAYHPFAAGPRTCIGNNFSMLETHLLLAVLAQWFSPRLRPGYEARWEQKGVLSLKDGLPMVIEARRARPGR